MNNSCDRIYKVNIKRLALLTLPTWLRRPLCGALVYAGVQPLCRLLAELRNFRQGTRYRLEHNGQVCKLRGVLNDEFDPEERRIEITEGEEADSGVGVRIWRRELGRWLPLPRRGAGAARIYREGYGGTGGYDFWVRVPAGLLTGGKETRLRAITNMYKLAAKRYAISYK